jgi:hypothetical protein
MDGKEYTDEEGVKTEVKKPIDGSLIDVVTKKAIE